MYAIRSYYGDVYTDQGELEKAVESYKQALKTSTDVDFIQTLRKKIENLTP